MFDQKVKQQKKKFNQWIELEKKTVEEKDVTEAVLLVDDSRKEEKDSLDH